MNSFAAFSPKDPKMISSLHNIPRLSIPNSLSANNFFGLPGTFSPTNNGIRTPSNNSLCLSPVANFSPLKQSTPPINPVGLNGLFMSMKIQQSIQAELFKVQMQQLIEIKNSLLQKLNENQVQGETQNQPPKQQEFISAASEKKSDSSTSVKIEASTEVHTQKPIDNPTQKRNLKAQIRDIIEFVLENFGRVSESCFDEEKLKHGHNKDLITVFDLLSSKYVSTIKTKEEMVKYTLRRAFKFIKNNLKKEIHTNTKGVSKAMCNKYFKASEEEISKVGSEEDFLKVVLPFRKNSKNKTMNTNFINEVFASEEFCKDYDRYLQCFESILEADNRNKIDRLASFIESCLTKKKLDDIKTYKRIPWPKLWITNTKNIAQNLPTLGTQSLHSPANSSKKSKNDQDSSRKQSFEEDFGSEFSTDSHSSN